MQCERKKQSIIEKNTITTTTVKNTLHIDFLNKQTNVKTHVCICAILIWEYLSLFYNQNLVIRSTFVFFGVVEEGAGGDGAMGVAGNWGKPAAAIIVVMKCCCIINIIIEAAIGLNNAGFGPGNTLLKSGNDVGVAILLWLII
jgi:hypothetical protein